MENIRRYIAFRYPNWLDYARHMARVHHFSGWEEDLLNDVICDLLTKPYDKLQEMLTTTTKKVVNGTPTTELDKFVLKMLNINATSPVAPFRKNTLGKKVISRAGGKIKTAQHTDLNGYDSKYEEYDEEQSKKLDRMHLDNIRRLLRNGFNNEALAIYEMHFMNGFQDEQDQILMNKIRQFLINKTKTLLDD